MSPLPAHLGRTTAATVAAAGLGGAALLAAELVAAHAHRYAVPSLDLAMRTTVGPVGARPLRLTLLGDASALGVGVESVTDTLGGQLAELLSGRDGPRWLPPRRVELSSVAVAGSRSVDLATQVSRALVGPRPDMAVILIGAGDATGLHRPAVVAEHLAAAVRRLREAGTEVVVGTCPDLGACPAFAPPLRQLYGWWGRRIGRAQAIATQLTGGEPVDLAAETGAVFRADHGAFCFDGFHPSADGYRVWAHALFPAVHAALNPQLRN